MKRATTIFLFTLAFCFSAKAQLNMELLSQVQYNEDLNDVWGWADPETGIEYAIVGLRNGTSIVSLEDPTNATQVAYIPGPSSTWRDIKTWGNYAYVTNETSNGLLVIDMSDLPNSAPYIEWTPTLPDLGTLEQCHNLYIDEFGYCYLAGCNLNAGGMLILNVDTETGEPEFLSAAPPIYAHDVYTVSNRMYSSEIYEGSMAIYDVTDKQDIQLLATQPTPFSFTHNIWLTDDETVAFTTDERPDAPVAAYDITDLNNIQELDKYNPVGSLGSGVIPHNVHVWDEYLLISYYTDGGKIVDASHPDNLIEVGNFDTWLGNDGGFDGAWGLYPFLPSQTVLVSDINNGLYVLEPTFMRACRLEGIVTDELSGANLAGVSVEIDSEQPNYGETDVFGEFKTGQVLSGTFDVTFEKSGYYPKTISVELENGELTYVEVELSPLGMFTITGSAVEAEDGSPVPGALVQLIGDDLSYYATADGNGNFSLQGIVDGEYDIVAAQWGYLHAALDNVTIEGNTAIAIEMTPGYQDDFFVDLGWTTDEDGASSGLWELGEPNGTIYNGNPSNPDLDVDNDLGSDCYVTGNGGGQAGDDDVDGGDVTLYSPVMDLSDYIDPVLSCQYWFFNDGGNGGAPNDQFSIRISNGNTEVEVLNTTASLPLWRSLQDIHINQAIELTNQMQIIVETGDDSDGHLVEGAFDNLLIEEQGVVNNSNEQFAELEFIAYPNPFSGQAELQFDLKEVRQNALVNVYNITGQKVESHILQDQNGRLAIGHQLTTGIYMVNLVVDGQIAKSIRVVKAK
ncbi:MAG: choice-of-anchor B family protein [Chitinophagales bacterium]|nr:choice-of-anchor B family protein [Chitinophagales bacterium]